METMVGLYLCVLSGVLLLIAVWQSSRGTVELLSIRNIALIGFIIFQLTSAAIRLFRDYFEIFRVTDPAAVGLQYSVYCTVFIAIAMFTYSRGWCVRRIAWKLGANKPVAGVSFQIGMAIILTILAITMRFAVAIPYVAIISIMVGVGFSAVACGLAGWAWARQMLNPMMILFVLVILGINFLAVIWGEFGRRNLVAVLGGLIWGVYYARWRYLSTLSLVTRLGLLSVGPFIILALYTSVRSADAHDRTTLEHLQEMARGDILEGTALLLDGQATGTAAMWCVENFPENHEYDHLSSLIYMFAYPVPRAWWPGKPEPLSTKMASWARLNQINRDRVKLPAGVVGNGVAEGGWYAIILYAILSGIFLRFFDEVVRSNPVSPFVVLPVGCQLGQVLGLARGETSIFAMQYVISFAGVWFSMAMVARFLVRAGLSPAEELPDDEHWEHDAAA